MTAAASTENNNRDFRYVSAIGGMFKTINIEASTVTAHGGGDSAGIGTGHSGFSLTNTYFGAAGTVPISVINIEDSNITATALNGAAIGTGCNLSDYIPQTVNVNISGNSKVVARSVNGAAIGGSMKTATVSNPGNIVISPGIGDGWNPGNNYGFETASLFSLGVNDVVDTTLPEDVTNNIFATGDTLTVTTTASGTPAILAESGVCAISAETITTDVAIIQNTLNTAATSHTPLYIGDKFFANLHKDFKSVARTAGAGTINDGGEVTFGEIPAGRYGMTYGSGTDAPILVSTVAPLYGNNFYVKNAQINRFWTQTATPISGSVKITDGTNEITETDANTELFVDASAVVPSDAVISGKISYQWYKNDVAITDATSATYTPVAGGVYHCVLSGSEIYCGSVKSSNVSVYVAVTEYPLWISGVQVTSDNASDVLGDGTVKYDNATKTLTLDNATITGTYSTYNAGIYAEQSLNIILKGNNNIGGTLENTTLDRGIFIDSKVDTLTIKGTNRETDSLTINVNDTANYQSASGISGSSGAVLENASFFISENEAPDENNNTGIGTRALTVKNCNLTINGFKTAGIHASGKDVSIDGSTVTIDTNVQSSPDETPFGIFAAKALGINNSDVTIISGFGAIYSDINEASIHIKDSTLDLTHTEYFGIYNKNGGITIENTTGTLAGARPFNSAPTFIGISVEAITDMSGINPVQYVPEDNNTYKYCRLFVPAKELGITLVQGAQVRIGEGVTAEGKVTDGSGLRFIAKVDRNDTLANEADEIGVRITAEGSSLYTDIIAEKWQNLEQTAFTAAVTNINVSNYNRKFTATPYAVVNGEYTFGESVTRSIYQVSAGLLTTGNNNPNYDDNALNSKILYDVLNAYVNQTGIRLMVTDTDMSIYNVTGSTNNYSGNAFFTVSNVSVENGVYTASLTVVGEKTQFKDYWSEFIRINNTNSAVKNYVTLDIADDKKSATIRFDYASMK